MNKSALFFLLANLVAFHFFPAFLWASEPAFRHFTTDDGLPSPEVYDVGFDVFGRPWFSTDRGLCCFDGYEWHTYTMEDGLSSNTLLGVFEGKKGELWFYALDGSMNSLVGRNLEAFRCNEELLAQKPTAQMVHAFVPGGDGRIYLSYWAHKDPVFGSFDPEQGDFRLEPRDELERKYDLLDFGDARFLDLGGAFLPLNKVGNATFLPDGTVYYNPMPYNNNKVFMSRLGEKDHVHQFNSDALIHHLYWEAGRGLWVATSKGLLLFEQGDLEQAPKRFLDGVAVSRIGIGPDGSYWLTTLEEGVYWSPSMDVIGVDLHWPGGGLSRVTSLGAMEHHLVCGTHEGRIFTVNENTEVEKFAGEGIFPGLLAHANEKNGRMLLGEYDLFEGNGKVEVRPAQEYRHHSLRMELENGAILHAGQDGYVVSRKGEVLYENGKWPHRIRSCLEVGNTLYLATVHGLWAIKDEEYNRPRKVLPGEPLLNGQLNHLCADEWGNLWISSIGGGLLYMAGNRIYHYSKGRGLFSNQVNRSRTQPGGVLWSATTCGLVYLKYNWNGALELQEVRILTRDDGLPDDYIQDVAHWNGKVWLATGKGLHYIDPTFPMACKAPAPKVFLEEVIVNDQHFLESPGLTRLSHKQNDILFRFMGISMRHSGGSLRYRYRIQGDCFPPLWRLTKDRTVRFLNLAPGDYTFEVQARNRQGEWSPQAASCHFSIRPHFTQQKWFQGLAVLTFLSIVGSGFMYRARRYRKRVETQRRLQEAEISALRSQMNPHFVFNSLNSIQNFIFRKDTLSANYYLSRFSRLMREGLLFSRSSTIRLSEELEFLGAYLELEKMRFPDRFDFEVEVDDALDLKKVCLPPFLCQPLLENAIKHGFKEIARRGRLKLSFVLEGEAMLRVEVCDNGCGLEGPQQGHVAAYHDSMGLKIVRERIALLNSGGKGPKAIFELENRQEGGVLAWFTLPLVLRS